MTRASERRAAQAPADSVDGAHGRAELLRDGDRRAAWMLLVDGIPQSHVDLDDPGYLDFEYVRRLGHVIDTAAPAAQPLHVLHLGAGALTLARYVAATRPGSSQVSVEVDAALVDLVRRRLPLRGVRVRIGDARAVLERMRAGAFDVVIADVFAGGRTPAHLTTVEFMQAARRALTSGVFAANVADGAPLAHARAQVATARTVFPQVGLIADAAVLRGRRFGNLVLVASPEPLPAGALTRLTAADPMPGRVLYGADLTRFTAGAKPVTDANASPSPEPPADAFASLAAPLGARLRPPAAAGAVLPLGPDPHRDLDRAALETELLAQPPLHEPPVGRLEEPRGEQDEVRRPDPRLGGEQDLRLPAAAYRRRGRSHQAGQPGVKPAGRDPGLPAGQGLLKRGRQPVGVPPAGGRDINSRRPAGGVQLAVDLPLQVPLPILVD
jgi:predicted O-methyltransferase YrrM